MFKSILQFLLSNISFLFSLISCLRLFFKIKKKKIDIYFSPEGGFGPTISKYIILRCKYKKDNNFLLIFGYNPKRHNKLVSELFDQNFEWLSLTNKLIPYMTISETNKYLIFKILKYLLKNFSNATSIEYINDYFCDLWNINSFPQEKENQYGSYKKIHKYIHQNEEHITFNKDLNINIKKKINFELSEKKCSIFLRNKGFNSKDISARLRDTDIFENYKDAIEKNIKKGWQFFLSGDQIKKPDWAKKYESKLIFFSDTKLSKDEYNIFTGVNSDCFISSGSGPVSWKFLEPKKPFLIIDGYPFAFGWYKSTIAYKIINDTYKFKTFQEIFSEKGLEIEPPINSSFLNSMEKTLIISEFLDNFNFGKIAGLNWKELNLKEDCLLNAGYAKASKEWFKIQKSKFN